MELLLTEEQAILRESAARFADRHAASRRDLSEGPEIDRTVWAEAAAAGWQAILAPQAHLGLELGLTELCLYANQAGKCLVPEPIAAAASIARALAADEVSAPLARSVTEGTRIVLPALVETPEGLADDPPAVSCETSGDGVTLDGTKTNVVCATDADGFLVSAKTAEGTVLAYTLRPDAATMSFPLADGTRSSTVTLAAASGDLIAGVNRSSEILTELADALYLSNAAELLGVMETAHELTVEYLGTRRQFDRPIGSFQALQHRAVDNLAAIEMCRSLVYQSARAIDKGTAAPGLSSAALAFAAENALGVCKSAIQMHGATGFTDQNDIGRYLKRAMTLSARFGNARQHRNRYRRRLESSL